MPVNLGRESRPSPCRPRLRYSRGARPLHAGAGTALSPHQREGHVRAETSAQRVHSELVLTGTGVIVAVLDWGDVEHPDVPNPDSTTGLLRSLRSRLASAPLRQ